MTAVEWTPEQRALVERVTESKYCPRCQTTKPRSQFPKNRSAGDGLHSYCKPCHKERNAASNAAYNRASARLRHAHMEEFADLFEDEKRKAGLT